jgi:hypothetical protein
VSEVIRRVIDNKEKTILDRGMMIENNIRIWRPTFSSTKVWEEIDFPEKIRTKKIR